MLVLVTTIFPGGEAPQAAALVAGAVEQHQAAVYRHVDRSGEVQTAAVAGHRPVSLPRRAMPESLVESASASMPPPARSPRQVIVTASAVSLPPALMIAPPEPPAPLTAFPESVPPSRCGTETLR